MEDASFWIIPVTEAGLMFSFYESAFVLAVSPFSVSS